MSASVAHRIPDPMANPAKLREQARAYELRDQWREAIGAYHELIEAAEGGDVDIALWNRIGDLHLRLNETELAIQAYESAVTAYVDVGLYNNAIALCRKILRLVPGRAATYLRLGQISAAKGFFADARQNFLEYAERMRKAGKVDAAFDALKEFADLTPEPADVRRLLAEQFLSHGRKDEAVEQLRILLGPLVETGDAAGAEAVRQQIRGIDPDASTEPLVREGQSRRAGDDLHAAMDHGELRPSAAQPSAAPAADAGSVDYLPTVDGGEDYGTEVAPLAGLETTMMDSGDEPAPLRRAAAPSEDEQDDDVGALDLPLLDGGDDAAPDPGRFGEVSLDQQPMDFPAFGDAEDDEDGDDDLPFLDLDAPPAAPARPTPPQRDRLEELRERVAARPADEAARDELIA
ncbi:MAG TPA: tetratricopeptide repeat protein, partial [Longimicrobium sp.]|nr:tetratricopeptide repeat protein [Longimicrobium sp.]